MSDFTEAYKRIGDEEEDFDISFWQIQNPEVIFEATMQLIQDAEFVRNGHVVQLRLDRTVESYQPMQG